MPLLVFIWLVAVLDDPERNFPAMDPDDTDVSGALVIARMLITQFSWLLLLFLCLSLREREGRHKTTTDFNGYL